MTFDTLRLRAKAKYQTTVLMRRYSVVLVESEARALAGDR